MGRDRGRAWPAGGALGQTVAASASLEATELRSHILGNSWSLLALSELEKVSVVAFGWS